MYGERKREKQSHLPRRHKLQWPKRGLHVRNVRLQVIEGFGDLGLQLRRTLSRRACRRDLVEMSHDRGVWGGYRKLSVVYGRFGMVEVVCAKRISALLLARGALGASGSRRKHGQ